MNSTIETYAERAIKYLEFAGTERPTQDTLNKFRVFLHSRKLGRKTINDFCIAAKSYYAMHGETVSFPYRKISDNMPNYFSHEDVLKIFSAIDNLSISYVKYDLLYLLKGI